MSPDEYIELESEIREIREVISNKKSILRTLASRITLAEAKVEKSKQWISSCQEAERVLKSEETNVVDLALYRLNKTLILDQKDILSAARAELSALRSEEKETRRLIISMEETLEAAEKDFSYQAVVIQFPTT